MPETNKNISFDGYQRIDTAYLCKNSPCANSQEIHLHHEHNDIEGIHVINPSVISYDSTFYPIQVEDRRYYTRAGDARLYDAARNTYLYFDQPPFVAKSEECQKKSSQIYSSYSDIDKGNTAYYTQNTTRNVFPKPLFTTDAVVTETIYTDPSGSIRHDWSRFPNKCCNDECENTLSFIRDSQLHREDLMALQMRRMNEQKYYSPL